MRLRTLCGVRMVCVVHIKPLLLPVDIQHTINIIGTAHLVSVPILPPRDITQALWSQNHDREILLVHCNAVSRGDNALTERGKETNMHLFGDDF